MGGLDGGVEAEDGADDDGSAKSDGDDLPADEGVERGDDGDEEGEAVAEGEAEKTAEDGEDKGFKEELKEDIDAGGADSLADADFVGALGDGNEHNIHNTDTADDE